MSNKDTCVAPDDVEMVTLRAGQTILLTTEFCSYINGIKSALTASQGEVIRLTAELEALKK